jgi:hypothetical protein
MLSMKRSLLLFCCVTAIGGCKTAGGGSKAKQFADSTTETLQNDYELHCTTSYMNYDGNDETEDLLYDAGQTADGKTYDGSKWSNHELDWTDSKTGLRVVTRGRSWRYREFRGNDTEGFVRQATEFQFLKVVLPDGAELEAEYTQNPSDPDFIGYGDVDYASISADGPFKTPGGQAKDLTVSCEIGNRDNDD